MIKRIIGEAWAFFREKGFKETLLSRDAPVLIQFGKYGTSGVISVLAFMAVVAMGEAFSPQNFAEDLPSQTRAWNTAILHFIAFVPSNFVAYGLNRWLVFTPGRHSIAREFSLFMLVSFVSFALGETVPIWLRLNFEVPNIVIHLSFVVSSALVNFMARKFIVFSK